MNSLNSCDQFVCLSDTIFLFNIILCFKSDHFASSFAKMQVLPFYCFYQALSQCFSRPFPPLSLLALIFSQVSLQQQLSNQGSFRISHKTIQQAKQWLPDVWNHILPLSLFLACFHALSCLLDLHHMLTWSISFPGWRVLVCSTQSPKDTDTPGDKLHLFSYKWGQYFPPQDKSETHWRLKQHSPASQIRVCPWVAETSLHMMPYSTSQPSSAPGTTVSISNMSKVPVYPERAKARTIKVLCSRL